MGQIATTPLMLVVNTSVQAASVRDFIALAKLQPGTLAIGNGGTPEQFGAHIGAEIVKWAPVVKAAGVRVD